MVLVLFLIIAGLIPGFSGKFCPGATPEAPRCEAGPNQYKCGVFFENLPGKEEKLSWIGGLPDIFKKRVQIVKFLINILV